MNLLRTVLLLVGVILFYSCEKEPKPITTNNKAYFIASMNNTPYKIQAENIQNLSDSLGSSTFNHSWGLGGASFVGKSSFGAVSHIGNPSGEGIMIYFIASINDSLLIYYSNEGGYRFKNKQQFEDWLSFGPHVYQYEFMSSQSTGIAIKFVDKQKVKWTTSKEYGGEVAFDIPTIPTYEGNTFEVISVEEHAELSHHLNNPLYKVKINFTCSLYNEKGESMQVKDGEFVGYYENFFTTK